VNAAADIAWVRGRPEIVIRLKAFSSGKSTVGVELQLDARRANLSVFYR
jgi:hypothetical protein